MRAKIQADFDKIDPIRSQRMIIFPIYIQNERLGVQVETMIPPKEIFMPLGYNEEPTDGKKHYRRFLNG